MYSSDLHLNCNCHRGRKISIKNNIEQWRVDSLSSHSCIYLQRCYAASVMSKTTEHSVNNLMHVSPIRNCYYHLLIEYIRSNRFHKRHQRPRFPFLMLYKVLSVSIHFIRTHHPRLVLVTRIENIESFTAVPTNHYHQRAITPAKATEKRNKIVCNISESFGVQVERA